MSDIAIYPVERLELAFEPKAWDFAVARRAEIDAFFEAARREKPALWNGRVLLMRRQKLSNGVLEGAYLETDFASFSAWTAWGRPHAGVHDCFGAAAILSSDGAFLLGVMGAHTFNAGHVYFPCGTPDPDDIKGDSVDLGSSVWREVKEETGLDAAALTADEGWVAVVDGALIMMVKLLRAREDAQSLRARMLGHLKSEAQPELSDIRVVRGPADFEPAMPGFVQAYLRHYFAGR